MNSNRMFFPLTGWVLEGRASLVYDEDPGLDMLSLR